MRITKRIGKFANLALTGLLATSVAACKEPNSGSSDAQSLDNFAGGTFTMNDCSGNEAVNAPDNGLVGTDSEKGWIRAALTAVPKELQAAFFSDQLRGQIVLASDIAGECGSVLGTREASISCWRPLDQGVKIVIKKESSEEETKKNIKHAVVRAMGFILTDVILSVKQGQNGTELRKNPAFEDVKTELALAFLKDVAGSQELKLEALKGMIADEVLAPGLSDGQRAAAYRRAISDAKTVAFALGVFAESFDSWFCSGKTRAVMNTRFSGTASLFAGIAAELPGALKAGPADRSAGTVEDSNAHSGTGEGDGLGLWGRWGYGNGPLRQVFSNWGSFRAEGGGLMNFQRAADGGGLVFHRPWFNPFRWGQG